MGEILLMATTLQALRSVQRLRGCNGDGNALQT
jgi:hypothetical protein